MLYYNIKILSDAKYSFEGQDVYPLPFLPTVLPVKGIANIKFQVFVYINKYNEKITSYRVYLQIRLILKGYFETLCTG